MVNETLGAGGLRTQRAEGDFGILGGSGSESRGPGVEGESILAGWIWIFVGVRVLVGIDEGAE